jgi:hypothetical protein
MGMRSEGIMSVLPRVSLPANLSLELQKVTPLVHDTADEVGWGKL